MIFLLCLRPIHVVQLYEVGLVFPVPVIITATGRGGGLYVNRCPHIIHADMMIPGYHMPPIKPTSEGMGGY